MWRRSPSMEQYFAHASVYKWIHTSLGIWVNLSQFKRVLKSLSVNILRSRCEIYLSTDKCPFPPLQTYTPTQTYTRQLDWQGRLEACYFCSPCHLQRTSWSSPSVTHGRALVNCDGCLGGTAVTVAFLNLFLYHQTGGVPADLKK